jgi:hypothetical protein
MPSREEIKNFKASYEEAARRADRGGERPHLEPLTGAVLTAVAVFILLDVFATVMLPDRETAAFWPAVIITAICSGGVATIQLWRQKTWHKRHSEALTEIENSKRRHTP